jgi:hypothetical protein
MGWGEPRWVMTDEATRRWMKRGFPDDWTVAEAFVRIEGKLSSDLVEFRFEPEAVRLTGTDSIFWFKLRGPNFTFVAERETHLQTVEAWIDDGEGIIAETRIPCSYVLRPADMIHFQLGTS